MPDFVDSQTTELERKARSLQWISLVETTTYLVLFWFWAIAYNQTGTAIMGTLHGLVVMAFVVMVIMITPAMGWHWDRLHRVRHRSPARSAGWT